MRQKINETFTIPEGISCEVKEGKIICSKNGVSLSRNIDSSEIIVTVSSNELSVGCERANKMHLNLIRSLIAHVKNLFAGLDEKFVYSLEACNVHFPMTLKVDGSNLIITNFLGEKTPRIAKILSGVVVDIKGAKITVSSHDRESAGQTAANIEKATKVRNRDRRVFQDGIYITAKPGRAM